MGSSENFWAGSQGLRGVKLKRFFASTVVHILHFGQRFASLKFVKRLFWGQGVQLRDSHYGLQLGLSCSNQIANQANRRQKHYVG